VRFTGEVTGAMRLRLAIFLSLLIFWCPIAALSQSAPLVGVWQEPSGSVIRIGTCANELCLWLIAISKSAPTERDIHNPDPALRSRALCGLKIGIGFKMSDPNHASGGTLYDPKSGKTYRGEMSVVNSKLELRGYVGIPLFGRSEIWTVPTEVPPCRQPHP